METGIDVYMNVTNHLHRRISVQNLLCYMNCVCANCDILKPILRSYVKFSGQWTHIGIINMHTQAYVT
jgi:hypothetical protein